MKLLMKRSFVRTEMTSEMSIPKSDDKFQRTSVRPIEGSGQIEWREKTSCFFLFQIRHFDSFEFSLDRFRSDKQEKKLGVESIRIAKNFAFRFSVGRNAKLKNGKSLFFFL